MLILPYTMNETLAPTISSFAVVCQNGKWNWNEIKHLGIRDNAHLCAISLLRVWIDLIDSSGIDWKRFPDMSIDIRECDIKLEEKREKTDIYSILVHEWKWNYHRFFRAFEKCFSSIMDIELNYVTSIFFVCICVFVWSWLFSVWV